MARQADLFEDFTTSKLGNAIFCHQEFLEKLEERGSSPVGKRAALLLHRLLVDERRQYYKSTQGVNRGWRRSRLGGHGGNHFYAWWAPKGAPPLKAAPGFEDAPNGSIFVRDIRHHDDHTPLNPHSLEEQYLPIGVKELRLADYVPLPWTGQQSRFANARQPVRIVKGYPGSGKTTALWHAADNATAQSALYVTYSSDLAALARDHFDKFSSRNKRFHVITFSRLIRELLDADSPIEPVTVSRARFLRGLGGLPPRILGPWVDNRAALFDEMHAHLIGSALPISIGRFPACAEPRLSDRAYRERRQVFLGRAAMAAVFDIVGTLKRRDGGNFEAKFFPELHLAWEAVTSLLRGGAPALARGQLLEFDCIAVDEVQDLTPIEALAIVQLAAAIQKHRGLRPSIVIAGDEAQTVRPTDFEWGWFHDLLHHQVGDPAEFKLAANLRSPRRIAELVNRVWELYSHISKQDRPGGLGLAEIDEDASDQVIFCAAQPGPELDQLLLALSEREGLAIICLSDEVPPYVPEAVRRRVLTVFEAKGLDFHSVCILDPGKYLEKVTQASERVRRDSDIEPLSKRLAIDQLRVAISRPAERLYWLDVSPSDKVTRLTLSFLNGWKPDIEVSPAIPAVVVKTIEEELLDPEERVRLCESDARQYLSVKPEMAWTRAKQAIALLGKAGDKGGIADETVRSSAHLTLVEISFCLAFRNVALPGELGRPDLYGEAARHASQANQPDLATVIRSVALVERAPPAAALPHLLYLSSLLGRCQQELPPWLVMELSAKSRAWIDQLENAATTLDTAGYLVDLLPPLYKIFQVLDVEERIAALHRNAIKTLMGGGKFGRVLEIIGTLPEPQPKLEAECYEGLGDFRRAAECHLRSGNLKDALRNFRAIPDFEKALELLAEMPDHPAAESLRWIRRMQELVAQRPENFTRVMLPAEKKLLEEILEGSLGASRRKKAVKKAATPRKPARPRKKAPKPPIF